MRRRGEASAPVRAGGGAPAPVQKSWPRALLSSHRSQSFEICESLLRLSLDPFLFSWAADGAEVAPGARALAGCGRQKAELDRAIDDRQHLQTLAARVVVNRNLVFDEPAGGRRIKQPALDDAFAEPFLDRSAVEHRLQHRAAADDQI